MTVVQASTQESEAAFTAFAISVTSTASRGVQRGHQAPPAKTDIPHLAQRLSSLLTDSLFRTSDEGMLPLEGVHMIAG